MKNLGLWSGLLFLAFLAGLWTVATGAGARSLADASEQAGRADHPERGDVPGWVMITLMSAVLVAALLALAGPALEAMFNQAMDKVGS
ncbi:hypothetical protein M1E17_15535 [Arthrobacter sp. D1-29]